VVTISHDCSVTLSSRNQIDAAGTALRDNPTSWEALRKVQCFRLFRVANLDGLLSVVLANSVPGRTIVAARLKRLATIVRKLTRYPDMRLSRMADTVGARIICDSVANANILIEALKQVSYPVHVKDYLSQPHPKLSGYRGVHLTYRIPHSLPNQAQTTGFDIEVQVRTYYQHLWSLVSESMGEQVKEGGGTADQRAYLARLPEAIAQRENVDPDECQSRFPGMSGREVALVRLQKHSERPLVLGFGEDYSSAIAQLIAWEEEVVGGFSDSLLLVGATGLKGLNYTHSTFLGMTSIPLPDWMPKQAN
jgi:ppGpp synthetase/RelA/SpoT-type nucleotidyltranferase